MGPSSDLCNLEETLSEEGEEEAWLSNHCVVQLLSRGLL